MNTGIKIPSGMMMLPVVPSALAAIAMPRATL